MKIIAVSDLHGNLPELPSCDLLLIAGDICPSPYFPEVNAAVSHAHWLNGPFRNWLQNRKADKIVGIGGNHDVLFEGRKLIESLYLPWIYLQDDGLSYKGFEIYGCPWTKSPRTDWPFEWTFKEDEYGLRQKFSNIPNSVNLLLTHSPPYSLYDKTIDGLLVGSTSLLSRIEQLSNLKLHVFGHIHEAFGGHKIGSGAMIANVSHVDENSIPRKSGWLEIDL